MRKRFFGNDAGIIYEELGRKIIRAVHNKIIILDDFQNIAGIHHFIMGLNGNIRIHPTDFFPGRFDFGIVDIFRKMDYLPLQVGQINHIAIRHTERTDPGGCKVK